MKRNNVSFRQGAVLALRPGGLLLMIVTLLACPACSTLPVAPGVLQWRVLGESPCKTVATRLLEKDIESAVKFGWDPNEIFFIAAQDVDDDGLKELFITASTPLFSGVEGSWIGLYSQNAEGEWREIPYLLITHYSPRILSTTTNGFHDIAVWNSLVTYGAGAYRRSDDIDPAAYGLGDELSEQNLLPHIWNQCCIPRN